MKGKKFFVPVAVLGMLLGAGMSACKGDTTDTQETTDEKIVVSAADKKTKLILGESVQLTSSIEGVTWESDHPEIATVSANGLVESKSIGSAKITAKKNGYKDGSITIKVELEKIQITAEGNAKTIIKGNTLKLTANKDGVTWTSSDTSIATVDNAGVVTGLKYGPVTISAKKDGFDEGKFALEIVRPEATAKIAWNDADHYSADGTWTNSNRGPGETPIYEKSSARDGTCVAYFGEGDKETLTFTSSATVKAELVVTMGHNSSYEPLSSIIDAKFNDADIDLNAVNYTTDSDGQGGYTFKQVSFGMFDLAATNKLELTMKGNAPYLDDLEIYAESATTIAVVPAAEKEAITITNPATDLTIEAESTVQLTSATTGITYESSNTSVATVSETGLVTGVAKGTASIILKKDGMKTTRVTITVTEKLLAGEVRLEAELNEETATAAGITYRTPSSSSNASGKVTQAWPKEATLTYTFNAANAEDYVIFLVGRANGGSTGYSYTDTKVAENLEFTVNTTKVTVDADLVISGSTITPYKIGEVAVNAGENTLVIKCIGDLPPTVDFFKLTPKSSIPVEVDDGNTINLNVSSAQLTAGNLDNGKLKGDYTWTLGEGEGKVTVAPGEYSVKIDAKMSSSSHGNRKWYNMAKAELCINGTVEESGGSDKTSEDDYRYFIKVDDTVYNPSTKDSWSTLGLTNTEFKKVDFVAKIVVTASSQKITIAHGNIGYSLLVNGIQLTKITNN